MFAGSNLVYQWVPGSGKLLGETQKCPLSPGVLKRGVSSSDLK